MNSIFVTRKYTTAMERSSSDSGKHDYGRTIFVPNNGNTSREPILDLNMFAWYFLRIIDRLGSIYIRAR